MTDPKEFIRTWPTAKDPVLHVHPQYDSHSDANIVATREGLERLHKALAEILAGKGTKDPEGAEVYSVGLWAYDGEGYNLTLILDDNLERWEKAALPYSAEYMQNQDDAIYPHGRMDKDTYTKEWERGVESLSPKKNVE